MGVARLVIKGHPNTIFALYRPGDCSKRLRLRAVMDVVAAVRKYIDQMATDCGPGMKILLMDRETTSIVSLAYAQSEVLQKEIYMFELLDSRNREIMRHLNAIVFVRPTPENVQALCRELNNPHFNSYFLYFSYFLEGRGLDNALQEMAKADEREVVKEVKEFYADFLAVNNNIFTFNITPAVTSSKIWADGALSRVTGGVASVLLALKRKPVIRYVSGSQPAEHLAHEVARVYQNHNRQFVFRQPDNPPLLLILDRHNDPVTPLLNQWTYQAMIHELLGLKNNRVDLSDVPGVSQDLKEVVLSSEQDDFYKENLYLNFGEIGVNIKALMDEYQTKVKSQQQIESIADMKAFVENYPQFRKLSGTTTKHVAVASEMSRMISEFNLMAVSEVEQDIVTGSDKSQALKSMLSMVANPRVRHFDCVRLALLFQLRYGKQSPELQEIRKALSGGARNLGDKGKQALDMMHDYDKQRTVELFEAVTPLSFTKKLFKGVKGAENIYIRHKPPLQDLVTDALKGKLKDSAYPLVDTHEVRAPREHKPQDVIVFVVGGATFAEAFTVASLSKSNPPCRIIIGGTHVHNSRSFLDEVGATTYRAEGLGSALWHK